MTMVDNSGRGIDLDPDSVVIVIDMVGSRRDLSPADNVAIARFILEKASEPDHAYHYFEISIKRAPLDSPLVSEILQELKSAGRNDWVQKLKCVRASLQN